MWIWQIIIWDMPAVHNIATKTIHYYSSSYNSYGWISSSGPSEIGQCHIAHSPKYWFSYSFSTPRTYKSWQPLFQDKPADSEFIIIVPNVSHIWRFHCVVHAGKHVCSYSVCMHTTSNKNLFKHAWYKLRAL